MLRSRASIIMDLRTFYLPIGAAQLSSRVHKIADDAQALFYAIQVDSAAGCDGGGFEADVALEGAALQATEESEEVYLAFAGLEIAAVAVVGGHAAVVVLDVDVHDPVVLPEPVGGESGIQLVVMCQELGVEGDTAAGVCRDYLPEAGKRIRGETGNRFDYRPEAIAPREVGAEWQLLKVALEVVVRLWQAPEVEDYGLGPDLLGEVAVVVEPVDGEVNGGFVGLAEQGAYALFGVDGGKGEAGRTEIFCYLLELVIFVPGGVEDNLYAVRVKLWAIGEDRPVVA